MADESRRTFVKKIGAASALAAGSFVNWNPRAMGANDKVVLGLIGGRNQGKGDALRSIAMGAEIKTFCDIDQEILDKVNPEFEKAQGKAPGTTKDFQRLLDDKDIDGVIIATPDHWHARIGILACQAGKDIYIEKPLTQTIHDGQLVRDAVRKYKRIAQVGTQRRSAPYYQGAIEYLKTGKLGKICEINTWECQLRPTIGNPPDSDPPATVDYDVWLGPAPKRPFNVNRFHYNWRFFWDYGNSELGNQGVHMLDVAMWGIQTMRGGIENSLPTRVSGNSGIYWLKDAKEVPDTQVLTYDFGDFMLTWELRSFAKRHPVYGFRDGIVFVGSEATLVVAESGWTVYFEDGSAEVNEPAKVENESGLHEKNFLDCVRSRQTPNADVELGRLSTTICHLGNVCTRLRRDVSFDPKTETFGHDKEANAYLAREHRHPYATPKV
ncbi:MAG: Gfo/Idh/MocA family oxidoreductase [Acidobacteriota bacterium]|nr:Gfo/Idh/MocA family oxidoreductase [Acidobacteriota bacterium]